MAKRDDFNKPTKEALAKRVSYKCSNPTCGRQTIGPHSNIEKSTLIGVAAHISAASPGGPRYDVSLSKEERQSIENGIWLCENCASIIDKDPVSYSVSLLKSWKKETEHLSLENLKGLNQGKVTRPIIEMDLIYGHSGRSPLGYAEENFKDGNRVLQVGGDHVQFWDLNWNHLLVLMNNSSEPAFNIKIEQIAGNNSPRIEAIPKLNNLPPFEKMETRLKFEQFFTGTYKEADALIRQRICPSMFDMKFRLTYFNEMRDKFETIVDLSSGDIENII